MFSGAGMGASVFVAVPHHLALARNLMSMILYMQDGVVLQHDGSVSCARRGGPFYVHHFIQYWHGTTCTAVDSDGWQCPVSDGDGTVRHRAARTAGGRLYVT
jgi:hypothetical protein